MFRVPKFVKTDFSFETTNNLAYKDFRFNKPEVVKTVNPVAYPVSSQATKEHFYSTNKKELKMHNYVKPEIDRIPYP